MFEKFADYWNKDNVHIDRVVFYPIVDSTVRLANLKSGALDLIERVLATDIKDVRSDPQSGARNRTRAWLSRPPPSTSPTTRTKVRSASPRRSGRHSICLLTARRSTRSFSTASSRAGNQWVSPTHPYYQKAFPILPRDVVKAKGLVEGGRRQAARHRRLHGHPRSRE